LTICKSCDNGAVAQQKEMKNKMISKNETDVTHEAVIYTCSGIESCIAVFLNDRMTGLAGGAHIQLDYNGTGDLSPSVILHQLFSKFRSKGSKLNFLCAKIAGGVDVFQSAQSGGDGKIHSIHQELAERNIRLAAENLGGGCPRTVRFNTRTGDLVILSGERQRLTL
jgi:chemotaxis protein CheD